MKDFFYRMREKFARFMVGRYGNDNLNRLFTYASMVVLIFAILLSRKPIGTLMWWTALILLGVVYWRMFSKNVYRRSSANNKYLRMKYKVTSAFRLAKERWVQRRDYKFFTCPSCHTTLRVPKGKGRINIVCRRCGTSFSGKS